MRILRGTALLLCLLLAGCASLGGLAQAIQAPRISVAQGYQPEIRLVGPSAQRPLGGASVRLWANVANPNPLGITLSALAGTLALQGVRAADVEFPLGLPLPASRDTIIPLDIVVGFSEVPQLASVLGQAVTRGAVDYQLRGTLAVDAGLLGRPSFGPMSLLQGTIQTRR